MPWERCGIAALTPHLHGFEDGKADDLEATFLEFCHLGICSSIDDGVGEHAVGLEIV